VAGQYALVTLVARRLLAFTGQSWRACQGVHLRFWPQLVVGGQDPRDDLGDRSGGARGAPRQLSVAVVRLVLAAAAVHLLQPLANLAQRLQAPVGFTIRSGEQLAGARFCQWLSGAHFCQRTVVVQQSARLLNTPRTRTEAICLSWLTRTVLEQAELAMHMHQGDRTRHYARSMPDTMAE